MMFKRAKVVMLPTNEKIIIGSIVYNSELNTLDVNQNPDLESIAQKLNYWTVQHLCFLSDEEIKEGDWIFHNLDEKPIQWDGKETNPSVFGYKKIIATTDKSLYPQCDGKCAKKECVCIFPQPSQSFIEKYIDEYNKGNQIKEVMVEYEKIHVGWEPDYSYEHLGIEGSKYMYEEFLKVNPKDNTITIRKVKDSWNREEVIDLLQNCWSDSAFNLVKQTNNEEFMTFNKWIEENL